ncbi:23S rRNA (adenine(2030)-N(6))-methyltransferase RlmJ [Gilvimarinus xylanilyticus]|uniref:Ribosomal RNA large subunit methyltransferase J n=1 Tax=Gilvimarinus xylanilyticus TaxID=2944139 RepID=A0A9X2I542_9GAMM|nr:23S rRNA (adenine(2030)-N(6))-methyltransferase RlmJ [Gilvimarinus xylanilyticus]MCP8900803.1 23S rRNA (adenine(2030)-N(6))-methyltransferase RlmJ [Gilvimarinus xylanilyticus]
MLSYRHSFHAGNHADVLKHCVWLYCLRYLQRKETGLRIIDTHSGAGLYSLTAKRHENREFCAGIGKIYNRDDLPAPLQSYVETVRAFNQTNLCFYPGSPLLTTRLLRPQDELWLHELHGRDFQLLCDNVATAKRTRVIQGDGFNGLKQLLPPPTRRALVLMDPSYEIKSDYQKVSDALCQAHRRLASGCYLLWYPVVERARINRLEQQLRDSGIGRIQIYELGVRADAEHSGMSASGMVTINAPYTLMEDMQDALPWLATQLGDKGPGHYRAETLSE